VWLQHAEVEILLCIAALYGGFAVGLKAKRHTLKLAQNEGIVELRDTK
jgi:hypothetical protein